jgi:hypothetical protein
LSPLVQLAVNTAFKYNSIVNEKAKVTLPMLNQFYEIFSLKKKKPASKI